MGLIFNEKVVEMWDLWDREQCMVHCLRENNQKLRLLFTNSSRNSVWSSWNAY